MKCSEIRVGTMYRNKGKGNTRRIVLAIVDKNRPEWAGRKPFDPEVLYLQNGSEHRLYLSAFARWAGGEVKEGLC